jgi:ribosomal protein S27E
MEERDMHGDYNLVQSLTEDEFRRRTAGTALKDPYQWTMSDAADIEKIELLLDVRAGILKNEQLYLGKATCEGCGRTLTMYDFVLSGIVDAEHSKSFILHTLIGNKLIINKARIVRCSVCATRMMHPTSYAMVGYRCTQEPPAT